MPVGVDAHIDPAVRDRKIAQTIGENAHRLVGADASVRPLGNNKFAVTYRKKRNIPRHAVGEGFYPSRAGRTNKIAQRTASTQHIPFRIGASQFAALYRREG